MNKILRFVGRWPIFTLVLGSVFSWFFYELVVVPYVPRHVAKFLEQQCEERGGRVIGEWPVVADGYLLSTKRAGIDRRNPYRESFLTERGFSFMEYNARAIGDSFTMHYREDPSNLRSPRHQKKIDSPFIRVTLEDVGSELCGDAELEARLNKNLKKLPPGKCMAIVELSNESELWSRYEYRDERITENNDIQPIDWKVRLVIDRESGMEVVGLRGFFMCLSRMKKNAPTGGSSGCFGSLYGAPTLFMCPKREVGESKIYQAQRSKFINNAIVSRAESIEVVEDE